MFTSLHQIPYGEVWSVEDIAARQEKVASYGLEWDTVESVPVSEDIKLRSGDFDRHIENYKQTIRNLAARGIKNIIYNFMPVLDWDTHRFALSVAGRLALPALRPRAIRRV